MLINKSGYHNWTDDDIWHAFSHILAKESPLPGIDRTLEEYRPLFARVLERIRREHAACKPRYFRTPDGTPIVNPLNIEHLTRLLHPFTRSLYEAGAPEPMLDCLFYIMKGRCHLNLFYLTQEIDYFFPLHALGSVIGYGDFGRFLIVTQQCTIGHNHGKYPAIGDGLWMGPGSSILGNSRIGRNVRLASQAMVIDRDVPDDVIVFGVGSNLVFKPNPVDNRTMMFDLHLIDVPATA